MKYDTLGDWGARELVALVERSGEEIRMRREVSLDCAGYCLFLQLIIDYIVELISLHRERKRSLRNASWIYIFYYSVFLYKILMHET